MTSENNSDQLAIAEQRIRDQDARIAGLLRERDEQAQEIGRLEEGWRLNEGTRVRLKQEIEAQTQRIAGLEGEVEKWRRSSHAWQLRDMRQDEDARLRAAQHNEERE